MAKRREEKKPARAGKPTSVWLSEPVAEALDAYISAQRFAPTKVAVIERLLVEFLQREGYLKGEDEDQPTA